MKPEEKVKVLSEELKKVKAEISDNLHRYMSVDDAMNEAYDEGYYDLGDYGSWLSAKDYLSAESKKLTKQREKLVKKLSRIIARHKIVVDDETAALLK